jgi:ABC-type sugar transport system permease subunit
MQKDLKDRNFFIRNLSISDSNKNLGILLVLPSLIIIFGVLFYPILYSFYMSLNKINFAARKFEFAGISNYAAMFTDKYFLNSIMLTIYFTIVTVFAEIALGTAMALVLNQNFKGRGFVRGIMILPWALPTVVNAIMWKWIYNANYGALNALLTQLHIINSYQVWLGRPVSALNLMIFANVWKETPYVVLLALAGLSTISKEVYEAGRVDGAGAWKAFWRITLPIIKPVILILTITKTIWAIQTFDLVYILTAGGPASGTELISFYIQKTTFKFLQFGYGASMSYALTVVTFLLSYLYIKFLSKEGEVI